MTSVFGILAVIAALGSVASAGPPPVLEETRILVGESPSDLCVGDFDEDHHLDLVVADELGNRVFVLIGDGRGFFVPAKDSLRVTNPSQVVCAHLDLDTHLDLVVGSFTDDDVTVFLGRGDGRFELLGTWTVEGPGALATADLDGDGIVDVAIARSDPRGIFVLFGVEGGGFQPSPAFSSGPGDATLSVASADLNGDGFVDLAVARETGVDVHFNQGSPEPLPPEVFLGSEYRLDGPTRVVVARLDGDNLLDVLAVQSDPIGDHSVVSYFKGVGEGEYRKTREIVLNDAIVDVAVADLDDDGRPESIFATQQGAIHVYRRGRGRPWIETEAGQRPVAIVTGDFDENGSIDVAVANTWSDDVSVFLNRLVEQDSVVVLGGGGNRTASDSSLTTDSSSGGRPAGATTQDSAGASRGGPSGRGRSSRSAVIRVCPICFGPRPETCRH